MIVCITGESGVGKDTVADMLVEMLPETKKILSYTTRPPRYTGERTHRFIKDGIQIDYADVRITIEEVLNQISTPDNWVAWTMIDGYLYWTEAEQFDKDKINIYVIDDAGLAQLINSEFDDVYVVNGV